LAGNALANSSASAGAGAGAAKARVIASSLHTSSSRPHALAA
jgi:hypothetical protein